MKDFIQKTDYCPNCHSPLRDRPAQNFCVNCGTAISPMANPTSPRKKSSGGKIILVVLIILVATGIMIYSFFSPEIERKLLLKNGLPTTGTIVKVEDTGNRFNDQPQVKIWLRVKGASGGNYEARTKMIVSPVHLPQFQPGARVQLRYDPEDRNKVAIEAVSR